MESNQESASEIPNPGVPVGRHVPFLDLLKIIPVECDSGRARFELTVEERHLRTLGILHGGVTATLLDTAMGMAAGTLAPTGHYVVTVQLNVNFIRPSWTNETLIATGNVKHSGRQTAVSFGEIHTSEGVLMATGSATFMYIPRPETAQEELPKHSDHVEATEP